MLVTTLLHSFIANFGWLILAQQDRFERGQLIYRIGVGGVILAIVILVLAVIFRRPKPKSNDADNADDTNSA